MDTSDSEAFESADENFDDEHHVKSKSSSSISSDEEENTVAQVLKPKTSDKNFIKNTPEINDATPDDIVSDVQTLNLVDTKIEAPKKVNDSTKATKSVYPEIATSKIQQEIKEVPSVLKKEPEISEEIRPVSVPSIQKKKLEIVEEIKPVPKQKPEIPEEVKPEITEEVKTVSLDEDIGSGWDDDVEWISINDESNPLKVEPIKPTLPKKEDPKPQETGWDDFDAWDTIEDPEESKPVIKNQTKETAWGGWGSWDVTSVLSAATESVSKLTSAIETGIGAPSPEEMAQIQAPQKTDDIPESMFGFGNLINGMSQVVNTGLDTLETIGKKTMEVLQEGDPRLEKKRNLLGLGNEKPCLSQVLREAKEKADTNMDIPCEEKVQVRKIHFESLFDDYQGLVHLEALEMLSKQCEIKLSTIVETLEGGNLEEFQETMTQVKELCELPDEEDEEQLNLDEIKLKLKTVVDELNIQITFEKLLNIWMEVEDQIKGVDTDAEVHRKAIDTLAQITSAGVEQFHKCAELLLVKDRRSTADEADSLVQLTTTLTALIGLVAAKFSEKLDSFGTGNQDLNDMITNVFFEATQSSSYVQDAFQLFVPILQIGAV